MTLGGELLPDSLQNCGIEYIFCSPGSEWTPVWEGLLRRNANGNKTLKYINCRHEMLAVTMATGYAKATDHSSSVLLHAGVGTLHAAMAIRAAYLTEIPIIIFSGETYNHVRDEEIEAPGAHWITHLADIGGPASFVKPFIKWSNAVTTSDSLIDSIYRGYQIAQEYPKGPVFISVTRELLMKTFPEVKIKSPPPVPSLPQPQSHVFEEVAQQLIESKQPIIVTEHVGKKPENVAKLTELAELLNIPVFETKYADSNNFPKNHPLHMGYDASSKVLQEADMVFTVGCINPWYPPSCNPGGNAKLVLLDENTVHGQLPYWGYQFDSTLNTDIGKGLTTLVDMIRTKINKNGQSTSPYKERLEYWQNKHDQMVQQWETEALAVKENKPISSKWFFHTINKLLPDNSVLMEETVLHSRVLRKYLTKPELFFKSVTGGLGVGIGEALGLKLAYKKRPVIFIVGDGTFGYNPVLAGFGLSQEYNLPILTIVLNNGGYMVMKLGYRDLYPKGWASSHNEYLGVDIAPDPDYCKVAEAFGAYAEKVEESKDIEPAVNRALQQVAAGRSALINAVIEKGTFPF